MNIKTVKALRRGDKFEGNPGHIQTVKYVYKDGVGVQCSCGKSADLPYETTRWGDITLLDPEGHDKKTAAIATLRKLKVGDKVQYGANFSGVVRAICDDFVSFEWNNDGNVHKWEWSEDLLWHMVSIITVRTAEDGLKKAFDEAQTFIHTLKVQLLGDAKTIKDLNKEVASLDAQVSTWRNRAFDGRKRLRVVTKELEIVVKQSEGWKEEAARSERSAGYYRDLLLQIAEVLGPEKFVCDDGSVSQDVLIAKIPELARARILARHIAKAKAAYIPPPGDAQATTAPLTTPHVLDAKSYAAAPNSPHDEMHRTFGLNFPGAVVGSLQNKIV